MGCDGGTIPKRDELVRTKKKPEQKDKNSELAFKWKHCAISQETLKKPIVACELGRLYNKESVLEYLLDKSKFDVAAQFDHLRGLKDIKELKLTDNPERRPKDADKGDGYIDSGISDFICPVVGIEMSGKYKFCFSWSCGCVISERALKEVKSDNCHKCGKPLKEEDVVILNGTEEEVADMEGKMVQRRALAKASKKSKKADKHKLNGTSSLECTSSAKKQCSDAGSSYSSPSTSSSTPSPPPPTSTATSSSGSVASKVGNGVLSKSSGVGKLISSGASKGDKSTSSKSSSSKVIGGTSIQKDPSTSKTFKSLFTSCEAAKSQKQAHWVTYNPMYY